MAYSADVIHRALNRLESMKTDRASVQRSREQEIYEKLPRVREIDKQLAGSMALAVQAAFSKGQDGAAALAQVREGNLALQAERKDLIAKHFPLDYLEDGPMCALCQDNGYIGSTMCRCLQELCRQEQKKEISLLSCGEQRFFDFRLDFYSAEKDPTYGASPRAIMTHTLEVCRKYAESFSKTSENLLFNGGTGLGKTMLSACIACEVTEKGYSVAYESAPHLFSQLENHRFRPSEETARAVAKFESCDLLMIDDLGTELPGQFVVAALYALLNERLMAGKPTVISTNLTINEIRERYSPQIASRMQGNFRLLPFVGQDIRILKNR